MAEAVVIAVLGAPGTGPAALAAALAARLAQETGLHCHCVPAPAHAGMPAHRHVVCSAGTAAPAAEWHARHVALTLLTALDPLQHGPAAEAIDTALRTQLQAGRRPWASLSGQGPALLDAALDAVAPLLRRRGTPRAGLLTRLAQRDAAMPQWNWVCERCDVPECEHARMRELR